MSLDVHTTGESTVRTTTQRQQSWLAMPTTMAESEVVDDGTEWQDHNKINTNAGQDEC